MDVIIIGAGKVGYTLAKFLSKEEDNITVIDNNIDALNSIIEKLDIMGIKGNGTSLKILHEAGISKADLVISVTGSDEVNMLCSLAAKKLGAKYTIARVRAPQYSEEILMLKDELGIDLVINPEKEAALEIAKLIKFPSVRSVDTFAKGKVDLVGFTILEGDGLDGEAIQDIKYLKDNIECRQKNLYRTISNPDYFKEYTIADGAKTLLEIINFDWYDTKESELENISLLNNPSDPNGISLKR